MSTPRSTRWAADAGAAASASALKMDGSLTLHERAPAAAMATSDDGSDDGPDAAPTTLPVDVLLDGCTFRIVKPASGTGGAAIAETISMRGAHCGTTKSGGLSCIEIRPQHGPTVVLRGDDEAATQIWLAALRAAVIEGGVVARAGPPEVAVLAASPLRRAGSFVTTPSPVTHTANMGKSWSDSTSDLAGQRSAAGSTSSLASSAAGSAVSPAASPSTEREPRGMSPTRHSVASRQLRPRRISHSGPAPLALRSSTAAPSGPSSPTSLDLAPSASSAVVAQSQSAPGSPAPPSARLRTSGSTGTPVAAGGADGGVAVSTASVMVVPPMLTRLIDESASASNSPTQSPQATARRLRSNSASSLAGALVGGVRRALPSVVKSNDSIDSLEFDIFSASMETPTGAPTMHHSDGLCVDMTAPEVDTEQQSLQREQEVLQRLRQKTQKLRMTLSVDPKMIDSSTSLSPRSRAEAMHPSQKLSPKRAAGDGSGVSGSAASTPSGSITAAAGGVPTTPTPSPVPTPTPSPAPTLSTATPTGTTAAASGVPASSGGGGGSASSSPTLLGVGAGAAGMATTGVVGSSSSTTVSTATPPQSGTATPTASTSSRAAALSDGRAGGTGEGSGRARGDGSGGALAAAPSSPGFDLASSDVQFPPLIMSHDAFRLELGRANAPQDISINMYDYEDHYQKSFVGKKQLTFVGYLSTVAEPVVITVLADMVLDRFPEPVFYGIIRTKTSQADEFFIVPAELPGKKSDREYRRIKRYLEETFLRGSSLVHVTHPDTEADLIKFEQKDPERAPNIAFGITFARSSHTTALEMFSEPTGSAAFETFLELLGQKVTLKGWTKFPGGLDVKNDSKGTQSYFTEFEDFSIMYHISTYLPYHELDPLKIVRARQVQNDIVMIIFVDGDPETYCYDPLLQPTNVTQVFCIVSPITIDGELHYRVGLVCKKSVTAFGPMLATPAVFRHGPHFRRFLLTKLINAQISARKSALCLMFTRPRQAMLVDIVTKYVSERDRKKLDKAMAVKAAEAAAAAGGGGAGGGGGGSGGGGASAADGERSARLAMGIRSDIKLV